MGDADKNIIYKEIEKKLVAVDVDEAKYFTFNETATKIFNYLKEGLDPDDVADKICLEFGVPKNVVKEDIANLINDLASKGLPIT